MRTTGNENAGATRSTSRRSPGAERASDTARGGVLPNAAAWPRTWDASMNCAQPSTHAPAMSAALTRLNDEDRDSPMVRDAVELALKVPRRHRDDITAERVMRALDRISEAKTRHGIGPTWMGDDKRISSAATDSSDEFVTAAHLNDLCVGERWLISAEARKVIPESLKKARSLQRLHLTLSQADLPCASTVDRDQLHHDVAHPAFRLGATARSGGLIDVDREAIAVAPLESLPS